MMGHLLKAVVENRLTNWQRTGRQTNLGMTGEQLVTDKDTIRYDESHIRWRRESAVVIYTVDALGLWTGVQCGCGSEVTRLDGKSVDRRRMAPSRKMQGPWESKYWLGTWAEGGDTISYCKWLCECCFISTTKIEIFKKTSICVSAVICAVNCNRNCIYKPECFPPAVGSGGKWSFESQIGSHINVPATLTER